MTHQTVTCVPMAQVQRKDQLGDFPILRAMIDHGSQSTYISERATKILRIPKHKANIEVCRVGNVRAATLKQVVNVQVHHRFETKQPHYMEAKFIKSLTGGTWSSTSQ
jgi:Putative peptidase (DUF1758)